MVDVGVPLELTVTWLYFDLARITLASQIEHHHRDTKELSVGAYICWHRHFGILHLIVVRKTFEALRRAPNTRYRDVFNDQVCILVIRFGVQRTKRKFEVNELPASDLAL